MSERVFFIMENFPDETYNKQQDSNLYKIIDAVSEELDIYADKLDEVRSGRFLDEAFDNNLDKIAKLLGTYRLFGETDNSFRNRIKARVPSFIGGGTITSIENILLQYLNVEATIIEHHKPENSFSTFANGVIFGMDGELTSVEGEGHKLSIRGGTAYINGKRLIKEPEEILIMENFSEETLLFSETPALINNTSKNKNYTLTGEIAEFKNYSISIKGLLSDVAHLFQVYSNEEQMQFINLYPANKDVDGVFRGSFKTPKLIKNITSIDVSHYIPGTVGYSSIEWIKLNRLPDDVKYVFMDYQGNYIVRTSPNKANNEILLYRIIINSITESLTLEDLKFKLDPSKHNITNTATISIQIPFDIEDSILTVEEINNIIMSTKAAGVAVLMRLIDRNKETITLFNDKIIPFFLNGFSFFGSMDKIGFDKSYTSLSKIDETFEPYEDYTWAEVGASSIGYQEHGGFE